MPKSFSIYLDIVRFLAALLVYLYHSNQRFLTETILPASTYGHSAVIVFFVLSGYVIAHVSANKETSLADFAASRTSRIFSVAIPALIITLLLDWAGRQLRPDIYDYPWDEFFPRIAASLLLLNEVWFTSITYLSNIPYWSICFEWWYYVSFALFMYLPKRYGVVLGIAVLCALGPKLLLLAPTWWFGVALYRLTRGGTLPPPVAACMLAVSILGIVAFHAFNLQGQSEGIVRSLVGSDMSRELTFAKFFLSDYVLGGLVLLNFWAVYGLAKANVLDYLNRVEAPVRACASYTFTLYLLHQPLFLFWGAAVNGSPTSVSYWLVVTALVFTSVVLIGYFTENRRHGLRKWLHRLANRTSMKSLDIRTAWR